MSYKIVAPVTEHALHHFSPIREVTQPCLRHAPYEFDTNFIGTFTDNNVIYTRIGRDALYFILSLGSRRFVKQQHRQIHQPCDLAALKKNSTPSSENEKPWINWFFCVAMHTYIRMGTGFWMRSEV